MLHRLWGGYNYSTDWGCVWLQGSRSQSVSAGTGCALHWTPAPVCDTVPLQVCGLQHY